MRAMRVGMSGAHLGEPGTTAAVCANLGALRAADVVQSAAKILVWMEEPGRDALGEGQRELANALFPAQIATRLNRALDDGSDHGGFDALFYPGQPAATRVSHLLGAPDRTRTCDPRLRRQPWGPDGAALKRERAAQSTYLQSAWCC